MSFLKTLMVGAAGVGVGYYLGKKSVAPAGQAWNPWARTFTMPATQFAYALPTRTSDEYTHYPFSAVPTVEYQSPVPAARYQAPVPSGLSLDDIGWRAFNLLAANFHDNCATIRKQANTSQFAAKVASVVNSGKLGPIPYSAAQVQLMVQRHCGA